MNESKGLKKWLIVKSLSAFLLAFVLSLSLVVVSPSLTAYAAEIEDYALYVQEIRSSKSSDWLDEYFEQCTYYVVGSNGTILFTDSPIYYYSFPSSDFWYSNHLIVYDGSWAYYAASTNGNTYSELGLFLTEQVAYSNHDILYYDSDEIFFQPPAPPVLQEMVLMMTPEKVLGQILGLLPLLIPFLVGLAAFWKGLRFLFSLLRKA